MPLNQPDINELKAIVDWVNLTEDVRELSIKFGDVELFISRDRQRTTPGADPTPSVGAATNPQPLPTPATTPPQPQASSVPHTTPSSDTPNVEDDLAANEVLITAPMVGTFYASPKPGDPPFVAVGDSVTASTVVGIVEVMKLMNNLEAKVDGTVARILVGNEKSVEYGQPLMVITRNG